MTPLQIVTYVHKKTSKQLHRSFICNSQNLAQVFINRKMDRLWDFHKIEYYSTTKRYELFIYSKTQINLKIYMLSERTLHSSVCSNLH